jgi:hypothetical protein
MHVKRTRRTKASMGALAAVMLLPVGATASVQTVRASDIGSLEPPVSADSVTIDDLLQPMASRSSVRAAMFAETVPTADPEAVPGVRLRKGEVAVSSPKGTRV